MTPVAWTGQAEGVPVEVLLVLGLGVVELVDRFDRGGDRTVARAESRLGRRPALWWLPRTESGWWCRSPSGIGFRRRSCRMPWVDTRFSKNTLSSCSTLVLLGS